jgi:major membrane immunogen (membrane-anchored lipoprotein)
MTSMKPTLRTRSVLALPLAATLLMSACGSSDSSSADTSAAEADVADTDVPVDETTESTEAAAASTDTGEASGYLGAYALMDEEFGTMTTVTVDGDTRTIVSNALPDHETGEFPNDGNPNTISAQDASYEYPAEPTFVGAATTAMTPGVAVNGVKFEPATAETVTCESGETLRVEALQDIYNLGLDFNNAHVQPTGEYHYHGISELLADAYSTDDDMVHVGFAADGYLMYYSKSSAYSSGYALSSDTRSGTDCVGSSALQSVAVEIDGTTPDGTYASDWEWSDANGKLDECNGVEIDGEYAYVITDEYPYVSRCLNGEFTATGPGAGGPPPGADGLAGGPPAGGPPAGGPPAGGPPTVAPSDG